MSFVATLQHEFQERLNRKTGWGKNEVWQEFQNALVAAYEKTYPTAGEREKKEKE
jgi:hypothetical protein